MKRRLFLKVSGTLGALSYAAPNIARAAPGAGLSPMSVELPFQRKFSMQAVEGRLEGPSDAVYAFSLTADLNIDAGGIARVDGLSLTGTLVSGQDLGDINIRQRDDAAGTYRASVVDVVVPVTYTDRELADFAADLRLQGPLTTVAADLSLSLSVLDDVEWSLELRAKPGPF